MENEIIEVPNSEVTVMREPGKVLTEAKKAADALMQVVAQKKKPVIINNEQYLEFEDWQTLARFYGLTVKVVSTSLVDVGGVQGYEAVAHVIRGNDGMVLSSAESMCLNDEKLWNNRPLFQLRSMAQTRACAKALRNVLAWVAVLAGFKPTPAEEMTETNGNKKPDVKPPKAKSATKYKAISEKQGKRLLAIAGSNGYSRELVKEYVNETYQIEHLRDIPPNLYEEIVDHFSVANESTAEETREEQWTE